MTLDEAKTFVNAKLLLAGKAMLTPQEQNKVDFSPLFDCCNGKETTPERLTALFNIQQQIESLKN